MLITMVQIPALYVVPSPRYLTKLLPHVFTVSRYESDRDMKLGIAIIPNFLCVSTM